MKLANFYNDEASEQWFSEKYNKLSVHESLLKKSFQIINKESLSQTVGDVEIPISLMAMSWGGCVPCPKEGCTSTFIAGQMFDLTVDVHETQSLSKILSNWMLEFLSGTKYLISLNPAHYLVATADNIEFDDVFTVSKAWSIDCYIGVFDETGSAAFIFDTEFWVTTASFASMPESDEVRAFCKKYNDEFKEIFIRDNHLLSHAAPERTQEYFDKVISGAI